MVNTEISNDSEKMGTFPYKKPDQNGSIVPSLFTKQMEMGNRVYKLLIHIEKIRPKPCPKSKKSAFLAEATRSEAMRAGLKSSLPRRTVECNVCKQFFQSAQSLYLHKKKQHCHICQICHVECVKKSICEVHQKLHETGDLLSPYKCHVCEEKFDSKRKIRSHVRIAHSTNNDEIVRSDTRMTRESSRSTTSHGKPIGRIAERTENLGQSKLNEKIDEKLGKNDAESIDNYDGVIFTCRVCNENFKTVEAAEAHTMDHMEIVEEKHKCSICKKVFNNESALNDHLAEHLSRALRCPVCPKVFINRATLRIHMKSHGHG